MMTRELKIRAVLCIVSLIITCGFVYKAFAVGFFDPNFIWYVLGYLVFGTIFFLLTGLEPDDFLR